MTVNEKLLRRVVERIRARPEEWDQDSYEGNTGCRTTRCVAGWAIALTHPDKMSIYNVTYAERMTTLRSMGIEWKGSSEDIESMSHDYARLLLGLTDRQASTIFYDTAPESLESFIEMIQDVIGVDLTEGVVG
jgi:hypothetical protein